MNIGELKEYIKDLPDDMEIVVQKDAEGNGYTPMHCADLGWYVPETTWYGDFYGAEYTAEDNCMEEDEWAEIKATPMSMVIAPIN